jgi:hypothetical protein
MLFCVAARREIMYNVIIIRSHGSLTGKCYQWHCRSQNIILCGGTKRDNVIIIRSHGSLTGKCYQWHCRSQKQINTLSSVYWGNKANQHKSTEQHEAWLYMQILISIYPELCLAPPVVWGCKHEGQMLIGAALKNCDTKRMGKRR